MADVITETKSMTCIICPMGCTMEVTTEDDGVQKRVVKVVDNNCPRGPEYVKKELLNPTRTLTTTIEVTGGKQVLVPVKTKGEVPKAQLMNCMQVIRRACVAAPVKRGDILIHDILGTGVNVIACADVEKL